MDPFREMELFVQVADSGSISKAAEQLGLSVSAASRYLIALETRLGVRLVQRTTRQLSLTEIGAEFYRRSKSVLADMREAEDVARDAVVKPSGVLRVTASLSFCLLHIEPLLPEFTRQHPEISLDIVAANRYLDVMENNVDVAIRTRQFEADNSLTIRRLAETRRVLAASPSYLKRYGTPSVPMDLTKHKMLIYDYAVNPTELPFTRKNESVVVRVPPLISTNDGQILVRSALDDMGILVQPKYIVHDSILRGELVPVLDDWDLPRLTMNIAFQTRRHMPAKVRLFIDALVKRFRDNNYEKLWTQ
ncbi:LysR family transcriptional regulator [Pseudomonas daroniae]|uniref:LysR family transcriptional regulator n=1 Tax=Phytopseudomonas daroniae TaxID=2487519 RepID=A0A4Q9QRS1_9GAMM|nr:MULTISPECIES: LysR family transcriptional regulator [Pseudomonas]TBU74663.1 LysR family transcriptional regulator [Pseudomonas daroniae]TBU82050.1 LysR family transcriptional regulator [Pseudomonas daroniae]TBU84614.1 LysR family transcriptional regulator [Pseudomonas sp. FRB 228]TBU92351.1 LysR family transcriptional regulator [Pseudomonas daroniae]